jgi:hypothetical protein
MFDLFFSIDSSEELLSFELLCIHGAGHVLKLVKLRTERMGGSCVPVVAISEDDEDAEANSCSLAAASSCSRKFLVAAVNKFKPSVFSLYVCGAKFGDRFGVCNGVSLGEMMNVPYCLFVDKFV